MELIRERTFDEWRDASFIHLTSARVRGGSGIGCIEVDRVHQVLWSSTTLTVEVDGSAPFAVGPGHAAWVPELTPYQATSRDDGVAHILEFWADWCPVRWPAPRSMATSPLTRELLELLSAGPDCPETRYHAERLLLAALRPAEPAVRRPSPSLPGDDRARRVAEHLLADPTDDRTLAAWGREVGASARTLARQFVAGTGLTFPEWRRAARIGAALDELERGGRVTTVARRCGYRSTSAFIEAFRREVGTTPGALLARARP